MEGSKIIISTKIKEYMCKVAKGVREVEKGYTNGLKVHICSFAIDLMLDATKVLE